MSSLACVYCACRLCHVAQVFSNKCIASHPYFTTILQQPCGLFICIGIISMAHIYKLVRCILSYSCFWLLTAKFSYAALKVGVGSLSLASLGKNFYNNLLACYNLGSLKERQTSAPLWLCIQALESEERDRIFSANHKSFQSVCVIIGCSTLHFLVAGDIATSWLTVETSNVPHALKLASGDLTSWVSGDTIS